MRLENRSKLTDSRDLSISPETYKMLLDEGQIDASGHLIQNKEIRVRPDDRVTGTAIQANKVTIN